MVFIQEMAGGRILCAQDKRGALAISPTIVILVGKHGVIHSSLILIPDVDFLLSSFDVRVPAAESTFVRGSGYRDEVSAASAIESILAWVLRFKFYI